MIVSRVLARNGIFLAWALLYLAGSSQAQSAAAERAFPQSKANIESALKAMQTNLAGRLPTLDGFATQATHPLDQYERGFFQATVEVAPLPSGGSLVHVTTKITAWYTDAATARSGYQLLKSNGRIESDVLDQLADQLTLNARENGAQLPAPATPPSNAGEPAVPRPTVSAEQRPAPALQSAPSSASNAGTTNESTISAPSAKFPPSGTFSSSLSSGLAEAAKSTATPKPADKADSQLEAQVQALEEVFKNQAHPKNLVAVKKSGTAVVDKPSLTAKTLFLADMHDEFEMLDFNQDWVHVRISGLSRGWIWRDSLEMPNGIPDTVAHSNAQVAAADLFRVTREESAQFPGDWESLRGKNVKILTIQKVDENAKTGGAADKLEFSKYLLDKTFTELSNQKQDLAGLVLVFDSADGGMIAATTATLQQWKTGNLSDSALWHNCFFDPPETFAASASSGSK